MFYFITNQGLLQPAPGMERFSVSKCLPVPENGMNIELIMVKLFWRWLYISEIACEVKNAEKTFIRKLWVQTTQRPLCYVCLSNLFIGLYYCWVLTNPSNACCAKVRIELTLRQWRPHHQLHKHKIRIYNSFWMYNNSEK